MPPRKTGRCCACDSGCCPAGGAVEALALRARLAPLGFRHEGVELDEVEALDGLRLAVLEDLEVARLESLDDLPVLQRVGVDADEVCAAAEDGTLLRLGWRFLLLRGAAQR